MRGHLRDLRAALAVAGVAAALPARNATRVEPAEVLRADG